MSISPISAPIVLTTAPAAVITQPSANSTQVSDARLTQVQAALGAIALGTTAPLTTNNLTSLIELVHIRNWGSSPNAFPDVKALKDKWVSAGAAADVIFGKLYTVQTSVANAKKLLTTAKTKLAANPTNATLKAEVVKAQARVTTRTKRLSELKVSYQKALNKRDTALANYFKLLDTKIQALEATLSPSQRKTYNDFLAREAQDAQNARAWMR